MIVFLDEIVKKDSPAEAMMRIDRSNVKSLILFLKRQDLHLLPVTDSLII